MSLGCQSTKFNIVLKARVGPFNKINTLVEAFPSIVKFREVMLTALTAPDKCPVEGRGAVLAAPRHLLSAPGEREWVHLVPHSSTADPAFNDPYFRTCGEHLTRHQHNGQADRLKHSTLAQILIKATHHFYDLFKFRHLKALQTSIPISLLQCLLNAHLALYLLPVGAFKKEKAIVGSFSGHCEPSRRFVDSSSSR